MPQEYDASVKSLFQEDPELLIPLFLDDALFLASLDGEVVPPTLRTDRTYSIEIQDNKRTLHLEFQAGNDPEMLQRILVYFALLWRDHAKPVVCMVLYLFRCKLPETEIVIKHGDVELLRFRFFCIPMWQLDAHLFMKRKEVYIYSLLPTMNHANASLLLQAIGEMVQYHKWNVAKLGRNLLRLRTLLERTDTVSPPDKEQVMQQLDTFDQLLEDSNWARTRFERYKTIGIEEGKTIGIEEGKTIGQIIGELKALRETILSMIRLKYPSLLELAEKQVMSIKKAEMLSQTRDRILIAVSEDEVRVILTNLPTTDNQQRKSQP